MFANKSKNVSSKNTSFSANKCSITINNSINNDTSSSNVKRHFKSLRLPNSDELFRSNTKNFENHRSGKFYIPM